MLIAGQGDEPYNALYIHFLLILVQLNELGTVSVIKLAQFRPDKTILEGAH